MGQRTSLRRARRTPPQCAPSCTWGYHRPRQSGKPLTMAHTPPVLLLRSPPPPNTPARVQQVAPLVEADFECCICFDLLYDPVVLGCGHDFCKGGCWRQGPLASMHLGLRVVGAVQRLPWGGDAPGAGTEAPHAEAPPRRVPPPPPWNCVQSAWLAGEPEASSGRWSCARCAARSTQSPPWAWVRAAQQRGALMRRRSRRPHGRTCAHPAAAVLRCRCPSHPAQAPPWRWLPHCTHPPCCRSLQACACA